MSTKYTKTAITTSQQIEVLKTRGLLIDDARVAETTLDIISYFRLAGYWKHLEIDHTTHQFKPQSSFQQILDCYHFDKELRILLFSAIQTIEVTVRSKIIKHFTPECNPFWFMDERYSTNNEYFHSNLSYIYKEVHRSHDDFIAEHFRKYSEPELPPVWKTLEVVSFGTLSKLFTNFFDANAKHRIAHEFGLNHHKFLKSWLECLSVLRNCCAHHSRVWNRLYSIMPQTPRRMPEKWITDFSFRQQTLYPQLCCVAYWINAIHPDNTFAVDLKHLFTQHPFVNPRLMGFPQNWQDEPLWN